MICIYVGNECVSMMAEALYPSEEDKVAADRALHEVLLRHPDAVVVYSGFAHEFRIEKPVQPEIALLLN